MRLCNNLSVKQFLSHTTFFLIVITRDAKSHKIDFTIRLSSRTSERIGSRVWYSGPSSFRHLANDYREFYGSDLQERRTLQE